MNYMTEIKLFNEWLETNELSTSGIALWYALMYIANRSGWRPELCVPVSALCLRTKLSRSAIYKERNILRDHGLVGFDAGDGRQSSIYKIMGFENRLLSPVVSATATQPRIQPEPQSTLASTTRTQMETQPEIQEEEPPEPSTLVSAERTQPATQNGEFGKASTDASATRTQECTQDEFVSATATQPCTIYKHKQDISLDENKEINNGGTGEKQKTPKSPNAKPPTGKKSGFDLAFIGDSTWEALVTTWLDYKQSRKEGYVSELSVKKFHTMLRNLSRGDAAVAGRIIDKSIANNWKGIFELTESPAKASGQPAAGQRIGQIKQPEDEERRRKLLEKFDKKK